MPKLLKVEELRTAYYRHKRVNHLKSALGFMASFKRYNGAYISTTIDLNTTYNTARQREENGGYRSQEFIGKLAYRDLENAKSEFRLACTFCEFRVTCGKKSRKEELFWVLLDDPGTRRRFRDRIRDRDFANGLKTIACARLTEPARIKKAEFIENDS